MRRFVVHGHEVPLTDDFSLKNLPGTGRLDLLCRCVTDALLLSHGIRDDVEVSLVLADEYTIRFDGKAIRDLHPDERSTAARIKNALAQRAEAVGHLPVETSPGVSLTHVGFEETLADLHETGEVYQLHEDGEPISAVGVPKDAVFVLSDHRPFSGEDEAVLEDVRENRLSIGPKAVHASQAITVVNNWLDTDGFATY